MSKIHQYSYEMSAFSMSRPQIDSVSRGSVGFHEPLNSQLRFAVRDDRQLTLPQNINWQRDSAEILNDFPSQRIMQRLSSNIEPPNMNEVDPNEPIPRNMSGNSINDYLLKNQSNDITMSFYNRSLAQFGQPTIPVSYQPITSNLLYTNLTSTMGQSTILE